MGKEDRAMNIDRHVMLADEIDILRVYIYTVSRIFI